MRILIEGRGTSKYLLEVKEVCRVSNRQLLINNKYWLTLSEDSGITSDDVISALFDSDKVYLNDVSIGIKGTNTHK